MGKKNENNELFDLRARIKDLATDGRATRKLIHESVREQRSHYWDVKRSIGEDARYHLLAYGMLRGARYEHIERPRIGNEPSVRWISKLAQAHCGSECQGEYDADAVKRWISGAADAAGEAA